MIHGNLRIEQLLSKTFILISLEKSPVSCTTQVEQVAWETYSGENNPYEYDLSYMESGTAVCFCVACPTNDKGDPPKALTGEVTEIFWV
jgi:hypothetical protein